jgi:hypothetical protein
MQMVIYKKLKSNGMTVLILFSNDFMLLTSSDQSSRRIPILQIHLDREMYLLELLY